jgi:flagellin FlaB
MFGMQMQIRDKMLYSFSSDKASIGIGAMIVFIAMVLVASIAASVLIETSNNLEAQALKSGGETEDEVSAGIRVYQIIGQYGSRDIGGTTYSRYHNMSIMVTPCSGTDGIDLSEVILTIANNSKMCVLSYGNTFAATPSASGVFSTTGLFDLNTTEFGIIVIEDRDSSCTSQAPVINNGDKALLTVNLSASFNGFAGKQDCRGMVIVEEGAPGVFLFRTPATSLKTVVEFF